MNTYRTQTTCQQFSIRMYMHVKLEWLRLRDRRIWYRYLVAQIVGSGNMDHSAAHTPRRTAVAGLEVETVRRDNTVYVGLTGSGGPASSTHCNSLKVQVILEETAIASP